MMSAQRGPFEDLYILARSPTRERLSAHLRWIKACCFPLLAQVLLTSKSRPPCFARRPAEGATSVAQLKLNERRQRQQQNWRVWRSSSGSSCCAWLESTTRPITTTTSTMKQSYNGAASTTNAAANQQRRREGKGKWTRIRRVGEKGLCSLALASSFVCARKRLLALLILSAPASAY